MPSGVNGRNESVEVDTNVREEAFGIAMCSGSQAQEAEDPNPRGWPADTKRDSNRPANLSQPGTRKLFLGLARLGTAGHFALGHIAGEATDVVLQDFVFVFELIVV